MHKLAWLPLLSLFAFLPTPGRAACFEEAASRYQMPSAFFGAGRGAVTVAAITVATDQHGGAATGAQVASSGMVHWQSGPMG